MKFIYTTIILSSFLVFAKAQGVNLTLGEGLYNDVRSLTPTENGKWLVLSDVTEAMSTLRISPRLLLLNTDNTIEWSVDVPTTVQDGSTITLHYDEILQQCYVIQRNFDCDLLQPDFIHAYDMQGNLLWNNNDIVYEWEMLNYSPITITVIPGSGLVTQTNWESTAEPLLMLWGADGTVIEEYVFDGALFDGIYHWRTDTLLLTRGSRLYYASYANDVLDIYAEQELAENIDAVYVLNDNLVYTQLGQTINHHLYSFSDEVFEIVTSVQLPESDHPYHLSLDEDELFAVSTPMIYTYPHNLSERTDREFTVPGVQFDGISSNNQQLVLYGMALSAEQQWRSPREGWLYDLSAELELRRDLTVTAVASSGITQTQSQWGGAFWTFDSISVTVQNIGMDTVSSLQLKIQKEKDGAICPRFGSINETFDGINLLPGESQSFFLGAFSGDFVGVIRTLCVSVGTEAAPLEYDYTNNEACTEVDIINSLTEPLATPSLAIYPNPSNGLIHFDNTAQWQDYHIYDTRGQLVRQASLNSGLTSIQLDISELPSGLYYLLLDNGWNKAYSKLVRI